MAENTFRTTSNYTTAISKITAGIGARRQVVVNVNKMLNKPEKSISIFNWIYFSGKTKKGILIFFPKRRSYKYMIMENKKVFVITDSGNWRYSDNFGHGISMRHECWMSSYEGDHPANTQNPVLTKFLC